MFCYSLKWGSKLARKIITLDCETDPFKKGRLNIQPFIWGIYDGETFTSFTDTKKVKELLENEDYIVYAHNGGKFDYHFLMDFVNPFEPLMVVNSRIAKMKIGSCEFRDSYSILPMSQENLIGKYKIDYDILEITERSKPKNAEEIRRRLKQDCVDLYDLVKGFTDKYGLNLTLASAAFRQWRKITGEKNPKTTRSFYDSIKPYYYGGRVQCFHLGEINYDFSIYDVNSAYPRAMQEDHPYGSTFSISDRLPNKNVELAFIDLEAVSTGVFPFRSSNGLYFPNDGRKRRFTITGYEFIMSQELGLLKQSTIKNVITFPDKINFKQYVDYFFRLKEKAEREGDKVKRNEAKLFLNGLYGKFAAAPHDYKEFMPVHPKYIEGANKVEGWEFNSMFGKWALLQRPLAEEKRNYYNLATGASITGYQRAVMMKGLSNVEKPLYCDTDSIICRKPRSLEIGNDLGQWKKEADCDYGAIAGKKLYTFRKKDGQYKSASKGVRLTPKEIIKVSKGEEITAENIAPTFTIHKDPYIMKRKIIMKKELQNII